MLPKFQQHRLNSISVLVGFKTTRGNTAFFTRLNICRFDMVDVVFSITVDPRLSTQIEPAQKCVLSTMVRNFR